MSRMALLLVAAMVAVIIGADFLFFRHNFGGRLITNIAVVAVFGLTYLIFLRRP